MARKTFWGTINTWLDYDFPNETRIVLTHAMSINRPAWDSMSRTTADDLHGVRNADGTNVTKGYFTKSKGLWYGWK